MGQMVNSTLTSTEGQRRIYVPQRGIIRAASIIIWSSTGTAGTNEALPVSIRKNATTDYLIQSMSTTDVFRKYNNQNMAVPMELDDFFEIKIDCPTWATNPTNWIINGFITMETE
jgi:xanthine dehydrogenase iron-sulfur cluster and FAD-binding subunit A